MDFPYSQKERKRKIPPLDAHNNNVTLNDDIHEERAGGKCGKAPFFIYSMLCYVLSYSSRKIIFCMENTHFE
jgi:hypothetical protein